MDATSATKIQGRPAHGNGAAERKLHRRRMGLEGEIQGSTYHRLISACMIRFYLHLQYLRMLRT